MKLRELLQHPEDIVPLARLAYRLKFSKVEPEGEGLAFCYDLLRKVSRSFALVIQQLPQPLRDAVCVFYLVLRALDTVEDDMAVPTPEKVPLLRDFHNKIYDRSFKCEYGVGHYALLMRQYPLVTDVFLSLDVGYQAVIADITKRMGNGMADFIEKEVLSIADYDLYCHYVAGLVGIGLSQLFAASGRESEEFGQSDELANHMGLFLQKTNIIRDYLEDIMEEPAPRMFWPRDVWSKHAAELADLKDPAKSKQAVACLNELVTDALRHAPYCLEYLSKLHDPQIFRFCALPQVMAIGTLAACYDNHNVFTGVVKMRRGEVARLTLGLESMQQVHAAFHNYASSIVDCCSHAAGSADIKAMAQQRGSAIIKLANTGLKEVGMDTQVEPPVDWVTRMLLLVLASIYAAYAWGSRQVRDFLLGGHSPPSVSLTMEALNMFMAASFLLFALYVGLTGRRI